MCIYFLERVKTSEICLNSIQESCGTCTFPMLLFGDVDWKVQLSLICTITEKDITDDFCGEIESLSQE